MGRTDDHDGAEARAFRYVASICGVTASGQDAGSIARIDPADVAAIPALVRRHRLSTRATAALGAALREYDPDIAERLLARARSRGFAALRRAERMAEISAGLGAANVRHLGVKGPVLAQQIYGDVGARDSKDLDFLVDPDKIAAATATLEALGYSESVIPDAASGPDVANKHRTFTGHDTEIELHTRLLDVEALLPLSFEAIWSRHETVMLGTVAVPALSIVDTMLYLCAHGAQHLWFRLKWLEDIARIATMPDRPGIAEAAVARAGEAGAEVLVTSALALIDEVLHVRGAGAAPISGADQDIVRLSIKALEAPADYASAPPLRWILWKLPVQFRLSRNWRYRRQLLRLLLLAPRNFDARRLPRGFGWLRLPLRPAFLIHDRWRRRRAQGE